MSSDERNARCNPHEPEGSYGCCWKYLEPENPASLRCTLKPNHRGKCVCEDETKPPTKWRDDPRLVCFLMASACLALCLASFAGYALIPQARPGFHVGGFIWLTCCSVFAMGLTWPWRK